MANAKKETAPKAVKAPKEKKEKVVGPVRIRPDLTKYVNGVSGTGKKTKRSDDPIAQALNGFTVEEVYKVASELSEVTVKDLQAKYGHLNIGMQRMNLGNRIRGAMAKQDKAHEKDKTVANGLKLLEIACEKPQAAVAKRLADKKAAGEKAAKERAAAASKEANTKAA